MAAVLVASTALRGLGYMTNSLAGASVGVASILALVLVALIPLLAALFLWAYAKQISYIPFAPQLTTSMREFDTEELLNIGIQLVGIYVLAFGVIEMTATESAALVESYWLERLDSSGSTLTAHTMGSRVAYVTQILLGYILLRRGKSRLGV